MSDDELRVKPHNRRPAEKVRKVDSLPMGAAASAAYNTIAASRNCPPYYVSPSRCVTTGAGRNGTNRSAAMVVMTLIPINVLKVRWY